jgi:hypothetical protein
MKSERGPPASAVVSEFLSTSGFSLILEVDKSHKINCF